MKFLFKVIVVLALGVVLLSTISASAATVNRQSNSRTSTTATPIKHLVVIFDENISFDHYFGTYPFAQNPPGEPHFNASQNTPSVNGLNTALLMDNPNDER